MSKKKYRSGGYPSKGYRKSPRAKAILNTKWKTYKKKKMKGKDNLKNWKDVDKLYNNLKDFFKPCALLPKKVKENNSVKYLTQSELIIFTSLVRMLERDNKRYLKELNMIKDIYSERRGEIKLDDFDILGIVIEKFLIWSQSYQVTTSLTYDHLVDYIGLAQVRKEELEKSTTKEESNQVESIEVKQEG